MKVSFSCDTCVEIAYIDGEIEDILMAESEEIVENEPIITKNCLHGHTVNAIIVPPKFDILFQYGCEALIDGYHREAVTGFAVALERYIEFFLRYSTHKAGLGAKDFEDTWGLTRQTERQTGAFAFMYLRHFERPLPASFRKDFPDKQGYRNRCVHAGLIPKKDAATAYGAWVYETIKTFLREIVAKDRLAVRLFVDHEIAQLKAKQPSISYTLANTDTALAAYSSDDVPLESFANQLERIRANRST